MRDKIKAFVKYYVFWVLFFMAAKVLFMVLQYRQLGDVRWSDWFLVPWHGLPLDMSVGAYITVIYGVLLCASIWFQPVLVNKIAHVYTAVILAIALMVIIGDNGCFPFWGYHIDKDVFAYLATPKEVLACAPWWKWLLSVVVFAVLYAVWWLIYYRLCTMPLRTMETTASRVYGTIVMLILTVLLFLPIRGSVTVSTMNTGRAYYSENRQLNMAAVNPVFNMVESLSENTFDSSRYHYMPSDEASHIMSSLRPDSGTPSGKLLSTDRPHIILFILESFCHSARAVMPNLQRLAAEGVYFDNIYANSYRTDRGVVAVLGGFPGCASSSVMLVPSKSQQLPQIGQVLKNEGYDQHFYYGGDEDFTNMRSYLITGGFEHRVADRDFPLSARLSKWGVPDHILFNYAAKDIIRRSSADNAPPQFDVILSLSSHEPFEVAYHHLAHPYLNAVAYTDSCLGAFADSLKKSDEWSNTVVVVTADHGYPYPDGIQNFHPSRYRIPLVFTGGAIAQSQTISTLGSQIDWIPTLLHHMGLGAEQFSFAKDLTDTCRAPYAYYHFVDGFALITPTDTTIIDAVTNRSVYSSPSDSTNNQQARAITQCIYESL